MKKVAESGPVDETSPLKKEEELDSDLVDLENLEEDFDSELGEGEEKKLP